MYKQRITNIEKILVMLLSISLLCITYIYWQPYDRAIIQKIILVDIKDLSDLLSRIIYYFVYFFTLTFLIFYFFDTRLKDFVFLEKRKLLIMYIVLFALRLFIDCLILIIKKTILNSTALLLSVFILESFFNIISVLLVIKFLSNDLEIVINTKKRVMFISIVSFLFLVFISINLANYLRIIASLNSRSNGIVYLQLHSLMRDVLENWYMFLLLFGIFPHKVQNNNEMKIRLIFKICIRLFCVLLIFLSVNGLKTIVLPHSSISSIYTIEEEKSSEIEEIERKA